MTTTDMVVTHSLHGGNIRIAKQFYQKWIDDGDNLLGTR